MKAVRALQPKSLIQLSENCSHQPISNDSNALNLSLDDWLFEPGEGFFDACVDQEEKNHTQSPLVLVDKYSRHVLLPQSLCRPQYAGILQQEEYEPSSRNVDLNITTHGLSSPQQKRQSFDETASETGTIEDDNEANNVRDLRARPQQVAAIALGNLMGIASKSIKRHIFGFAFRGNQPRYRGMSYGGYDFTSEEGDGSPTNKPFL